MLRALERECAARGVQDPLAGRKGEHSGLWHAVAAAVGTGRSSTQCRNRWRDVMQPGLRKGRTWDAATDKRLVAAVREHGLGSWKKIATHFPGVAAVRCRQRSRWEAVRGNLRTCRC